jgi:hypothetical protein
VKRFLLLVAVGCLAAAGCSDAPSVSPTAPEFKQPPMKKGDKDEKKSDYQ